MEVITTRFGTMEVKEKDILTFAEGLVGFSHCKNFFIYNQEKNLPFFWLQSVEDPKLAFVICDPALFFPDYKVSARKAELSVIEPGNPKELVVCVLISINREPFRMTANLQGPLVINTANHKGKQLVLVEGNYNTRHTIPVRRETLEMPGGLFMHIGNRQAESVSNSLVLT
ncbi:MAG: flagellar assembly protein FliW [Candidatus Glassbacteria bacterium]